MKLRLSKNENIISFFKIIGWTILYKMYYKLFFFIFICLNLKAQSFDVIKKHIDGELHLLREKVEKPIMQKSLYDIHFREFYYYLHTQNTELQWEEIKVNQKKYILNWRLMIPIEEQAYLHLSEANTLWQKNKHAEAIFLWKSLSKNKIQKDVAIHSINILQEKLKQKQIFEQYSNIDPYFLYNLSKNKTFIFSDKYGTAIVLDHYWYFSDHNKVFYFIQNEPHTTVFQLYNPKVSIMFYFQKIRENQIKDINDIILWMDWLYSWNENTKSQYQFTRTKIHENIFQVSYKKENDFTIYYEKYFLLTNAFIYIRVYTLDDDIDFIKNIQIKTNYE